MIHVKQIREIVESGRHDEAHTALDQLLALGPNNLEALKLRAILYEYEGRFQDETRLWERIAGVDREDPDALRFLLQRQLEDREHFYFTDDLPGGGRRFLAYPRQLISTSAVGLLGCIGFLAATRFTGEVPALGDARVLLGLFAVCVLLPWVCIVAAYLRGIKSVAVSVRGITVASRLRQVHCAWDELERVCLARGLDRAGHGRLTLVLVPKDADRPPVEVDLHPRTTAIRARSHLVREISRVFREPECVLRETLDFTGRRVARF